MTVLCSVVKLLESGRALKKSTQEVLGENTRLRLVFSPTLLSCSTALCVLYNRTAQSRIIYLLNTTSCDGVRLVVKFYLFRLGLCIRTRSIWYLLSNVNIVSSAFSFELFLNILILVNLTPFTINLQYPFPRAIGGHLFQGKALSLLLLRALLNYSIITGGPSSQMSVPAHKVVLRLRNSQNKGYILKPKKYERVWIKITLPYFRYVFPWFPWAFWTELLKFRWLLALFALSSIYPKRPPPSSPWRAA